MIRVRRWQSVIDMMAKSFETKPPSKDSQQAVV